MSSVSNDNSLDLTNQYLFPKTSPLLEEYLKVSDTYKLWYAEYGNPQGTPVIFLHGGPGYGCEDANARFFDPSFYRIILLDQRGARKSNSGEILDNNTNNLIEDLEKLRIHLNIDKWLIFGGSWGSTLGILYGESYPDNCLGFILRGIFLATNENINQLFYGIKDIFPETWDEFQEFIPEDERHDLLKAYYNRLIDPDYKVNLEAAKAFMKYDIKCSYSYAPEQKVNLELEDEKMLIAVTRVCCHFAVNKFFIENNQLLNNINKIKHLPCVIVHGRYDVICLAKNAYTLHHSWPGSKYRIASNSGHSASEPNLVKLLVEATEEMKSII